MKRWIKASAYPYEVVLQDGEVYRDANSNLVEVKTEPIIEQVGSLQEAMQVYQDFLKEHNVPSSQDTGGLVLQNNKPVAILSYNGRHIDKFLDFIKEWGTGIVENSNVLKSIGYSVDYVKSLLGDNEQIVTASEWVDFADWYETLPEREQHKVEDLAVEFGYIDEDEVFDYDKLSNEELDSLLNAYDNLE